MFSSDGTQLATPDPVDAVTQLQPCLHHLVRLTMCAPMILFGCCTSSEIFINRFTRFSATRPKFRKGIVEETLNGSFRRRVKCFPCIRIGTESLVGIPRSLARSLMRRTVAV